jgi:putative ABC transport system permease protein
MPSFFLAWQYLSKHRLQVMVMIAGVALALLLPLATHWLINAFDQAIKSRAKATPLVLGAKGSRFDLVLHSLYFRAQVDGTMTQGDLTALRTNEFGKKLAYSIPIYRQFSVRKKPLVGTSLDYFSFRKLRIAEGEQMALLGDCVLGAKAAAELDLHPGSKVKTDSGNPFDFAGKYPLQLNVTGVLAPNGTADDQAVFVDVKTAWILPGIIHGHDENASNGISKNLLKRHLEITPDNIDSFHFDGDPDKSPLTAILPVPVPHDTKTQTLLLGHYQHHDRLQARKPLEVVVDMMGMVMRVRDFLDANYTFVTATTALLLALIVALSRRLRAKEMETMFLLGCRRGTLFALQAAELTIIFAASAALALLTAWALVTWAQDYLHTLTG